MGEVHKTRNLAAKGLLARVRLARLRVPRRLPTLLLAFLPLTLAFFLAIAFIPLPERLDNPGSTVVFFRDGSPAHVFLSPDDKWRIPVQLEEVDADYLEALFFIEDKRFWVHPGIDPLAVLRALGQNIRHGRVVSGASTLTMQLVRMLEPRPRTLFSKVIEAFRAMQLELRRSKQQVLEAYLQFLPFGRNIEGVEAASLCYFGHRASSLSPDEIATLLAVPQNPNRRYPNPANTRSLQAARDNIAARLAAREDTAAQPAAGVAPEQARPDDHGGGPVPDQLRAFPREMPHAAVWLRARYPGWLRIFTNMDRGIQRLATSALRAARDEAVQQGVHNAAAIVVDHESAEIVALVGNFDFWDEEHGGQIVGFDVPRSVGSTLKPFVYAKAIDQGTALPGFLVPDVPMRFGSYAPRNYGENYDGLVTLEDALSRSLNVPFVELLKTIGPETFLGMLQELGARSIVPDPGHYGLAMVVGGIELTPLELAGMYAALAEDGSYRPLRWLQEPSSALAEPARPVFSRGAAFLTQRALAIRDRPDFPARRQVSGLPPSIHWKTGTSYGHRDAWAVGSGPKYTAAIWMGNFNYDPSVHLVGAPMAGPVLFDILEAVASRSPNRTIDQNPSDLKEISVCAWSGYPPTAACPLTRTALAIASSVPTRTCPFHIQLDIDSETGLALTPTCRAGKAYETKSFMILPARVRLWLRGQSWSLRPPPPYAPGCSPAGPRVAPTIVSPADGYVAQLIEGLPPEQQELPLEADSAVPDARLSWFVDGEFLGTVDPDEQLWWRPIVGRHEFVVTDETGLVARRALEVRRMH